AAAAFLALIVLGALAVANYGSLFAKPERISESTFYSLNHFDAAPKEESGLGFLSRLATFSVYDTTTQTRLATWKTVLASAKDYPLFGVGSENFILAFNKYFNPEFYIAERSEIWFDRAHNAYIDMLVMHGILGLGAYLFLYASCFFVIFRLYRRGVLAPAHALAFTLFFTAYGVQNFFLFDSFGAFLMWIVAIAYLNSFSGEREAGRPSFMPVRFIAIPLMAALIVVYMFSARPMMQSYLLAKAESGVYGIDASMALYEKALSWRTFGDNETRSRLALSVAKEVQGTESEVLPENLSRYLDRAIVALKENIAQSNQYHLLYRLQLSDVYNLKLARTGMASPEVEDIMEKSIAISPGRMEFEFALAQTAFLKNEYQKAVDILQQASKKNPDHPMPYWKIAQNYHFAGRDEKGIPYVEQAFYLGFGARNYKELQWVAEYYNAKKDYVKIVFLNKKIIAQAPQLVWPHMNLAIAYANLGQKNKAKEHAQKVGALDPSQQEAVSNFLNALR
ncbi:O-antigen ligase family protein, partial [Candidatus Azambacteria bacterium]|nr:O-antigen ligase family protein [Candidatus Azambacteria bacterium]